MELIETILRVTLFLASCFGYVYSVGGLTKMEKEFAPLFVLSSITLAIYLGGLLHCLLTMVYVVLFIGLALCIYAVCDLSSKSNRYFWLEKITFFKVFFTLGTCLFLGTLLTTKFQHYDNFSHWAIAVKQMICTDAFPTAASTLIEFSNYPLGTTSFIYYACRIMGNGQGIMLFAQGLIIFACFYAFYGVIQEKKRFLLYAFLSMGCAVLSFFNLTIRINNLLVDFILPLISLAACAVVYRYKNNTAKACGIIIPILGFLVIVKSTGVIFAAVPLIYLLCMALSQNKKGKCKAFFFVIGASLLSMAPTVLWKLHMKVAFSGVTNKFEVNAQALQEGVAEKTAEDMRAIVELFVQSVTDITSRPTIGFLVFQIAAVAAWLIARFILKRKWKLLGVLAALDVVVLLYYIGILGLYLFSMPLDEAIRLAGFERYASSIIVLFCGGLVLCATTDIERSFCYQIGDEVDYRAFYSYETKKYYQMGIVAALAIAIPILISEYNGLLYVNKQYADSLPQKVYEVTGDNWPENGEMDENKYLIYASDTDGQMTSYYVQYVTRYYLFAPQVDAVCSFYEDNLLNLLDGYDKLVVVESDGDAQRLLKKYFDIDGVPGIYAVPELLRNYTAKQ